MPFSQGWVSLSGKMNTGGAAKDADGTHWAVSASLRNGTGERCVLRYLSFLPYPARKEKSESRYYGVEIRRMASSD
jgi:hypothetical protein